MHINRISGRRLRYLLRPTTERVVPIVALIALVVIVWAMTASG